MNETELPWVLPGQGQHSVALRFTLRLSSGSQCLWVWVGASGLSPLRNFCTATSPGTALQPSMRPWPAPQRPWPWAGFAAQPKGTWLLLSFPAASHASCVYSGSRYPQCPHLVKPTGSPKPHNLVLDQNSYFQACLSPVFLLFGIPQAWSHCRNVYLKNRQFPVIQEGLGIHGYIHFCIYYQYWHSNIPLMAVIAMGLQEHWQEWGPSTLWVKIS